MDDHRKGSEESLIHHRKQHAAGPTETRAPDRRGERLQELYASALDLQDPRQSSIRYAMAELLDVGSSLADAIKGELRERKQTLREMRKGPMQAISSLAVVHRQATRYAQLDHDLAAARDAETPPAPQLPRPNRDSGET